MIINCTYAALLDLKSQMEALQALDDHEITEPYPHSLYTCRLNSGLSGVPWPRTLNLLKGIGMRMTVVYPPTDEVSGQDTMTEIELPQEESDENNGDSGPLDE